MTQKIGLQTGLWRVFLINAIPTREFPGHIQQQPERSMSSNSVGGVSPWPLSQFRLPDSCLRFLLWFSLMMDSDMELQDETKFSCLRCFQSRYFIAMTETFTKIHPSCDCHLTCLNCGWFPEFLHVVLISKGQQCCFTAGSSRQVKGTGKKCPLTL